MNRTLLAAAVALAVLAGCDRGETPAGGDTRAPASNGATTAAPGATTSSSDSTGTARAPDPGQNPTQQQIDPKEGEQQRDFRHPNEGQAPQNPYGR